MTGTDPMDSRLLDMRDCAREDFRTHHEKIRRLSLEQQPAWFRPLLLRSRRLKSYTGFDHWSREWEYPWAVLAARLEGAPLRILDVGGGGSPFAPYLADLGHECVVADPSLNEGAGCVYDRQKSLYGNFRSLVKKALFRAAGIHSVWGLPGSAGASRLRYVPDGAGDLHFPDRHFDRVFCLSVIEHIPREIWPLCMKEFQRVLRPGGRLVITQDMTDEEANQRLYRRLLESCSLPLTGNPHYEVPLRPEDQQLRHPGQGYETIGLVWSKPV